MAARMHRPAFWLLGLATAAIAGWGLWPRGQAVEVALVSRGPLEVAFTEEARTRLVDRWTLDAPVAGRLQRIRVEPGDRVREGDTLALIQPVTAPLLDAGSQAQARAKLAAAVQAARAADAAVASTRAAAATATAERGRAEVLAREQLVSASHVDAAREAEAVARAALNAAIAQAAAARADADAARSVLATAGRDSTGDAVPVRAPVDAHVIRLHRQSETVVPAGAPLLDIGDPARLEAVSELLTADAGRLAPGAPVTLSARTDGPEIVGRLERIEPGAFTKVSALGVEEQRVLAIVELPAADAGLPPGDGYRLEARFVVWRGEDVLRVPTAALLRDGAAWAVFVVDGRRVRLRRLQLGHVGETMAEVVDGVAAGDRVVAYPSETLADGSHIVLRVNP